MEAHKLDDGWDMFRSWHISTPTENYKDEVISAQNHFKLRKIEKMLLETSADLKNETDEEKQQELLAVHMHLNDMRKQIMVSLKIAFL